MNNPPSQAKPLNKEDLIYLDLLKKYEQTQIETLDESGKRLIDRAAATLGIFFSIIALGKDFPPAYLGTVSQAIPLIIGLLTTTILSMLSGFLLLMPRTYKIYTHNLSKNEGEYRRLLNCKKRWSIVGSITYVAAMIFLATLIIKILVASQVLPG